MLMIRPLFCCRIDRRGGLAHLVDAGQVDGEDAVPLLARELVDGDAVGQRVDAGVVDEDVEPAALRDDLRRPPRRSRRAWSRRACRPRPLGVRRGRGLRFLGDEVGVVDDAAVGREPVGDGLPDARGPPR